MNKKEALLAFIEAYRNLPELWDVSSRSYLNRVKKAAAYDVLIEKLKPLEPNATRDSVVKKINNLRSTFRKELKKAKDSKRSGAGFDEVYIPALWYFNDLMFLVDQETPDPGESTLDDKINEDSLASLSSVSTSSGPNQASFSGSKKRKSNPESASQALLLKATRYLDADDDEFLTLARGFAVKLRKLTPEQLMFADKLINDALFDGQMGILTRSSYIIHPSAVTSSPTLSTLSPGAHHPPYSSSGAQALENVLDGFSYTDDDDDQAPHHL